MSQKKLKKLNPVQLATVMAIVIDKRQLLTGGATDITEHKFTTKQEVLDALSDNQNGTNGKNVKMIKITEKSMQIESANFGENAKKFITEISVKENDIKNLLKNQGDLQ